MKKRKYSCRVVAAGAFHARRIAVEVTRLFPFARVEVAREIDEDNQTVVRFDPSEVPLEVVEYTAAFYREVPDRRENLGVADAIRGFLRG